MVKTLRRLYIDNDIWEQFQMLFPRQASSMMEGWMGVMISQKVGGFADDVDMKELLHEADEKKKAIQELSSNLQGVQARIQSEQLKRQKEAIDRKQLLKKQTIAAQTRNAGIRASGLLERIDIV